MPNPLLVVLIALLAGIVQGLAGFGAGLIAMPMLAQALGIAVAAPMFALAAFAAEIAMIARYRHSFAFSRVWRMVTAAVITIPVGAFGSTLVPEQVVLTVLGLVVGGYGLYALIRPVMPHLTHPRWAFLFGAASGLLSGAYNTGGPPYVIYGTTQGWTPNEFKANIQAAFVVGTIVVLLSHTVKGSFVDEVIELAVFATPAMLVGLFGGMSLDRFVSPARFRKGVQVALVVLGLTLIF